MNTMYCLVSKQTMANVLPVLMFKPKKVVLFATPEEKKSADNLQKLFQSKSIAVSRIDGLDAYDYLKFKQTIAEQLSVENDDVWLNVTGGTKLMALAAYEVFADKKKKIIYCDTVHQHIIKISPEVSLNKIEANLTIDEYLLSYGYSIKEKKDINSVSKFFDLFDFVEQSKSIRSLINLFQNIRRLLAEDRPKFSIKSNDGNFLFQKNFDRFHFRYGLDLKKSIVISQSEFKSGDWLEYYTFYILKKKNNLSPYTGVKIVSSENVENEIDILVLKDYMLYNFSCKSGKSDNQFDLYQLETLRAITSGTFGKGIFVTANEHSDSFKQRAKELSINIINILTTNEINL